jgi:hypothetical protein
VITWFRETCIPGRTRFLTFDIESFYPSISESLLDKAIVFAQSRSDLSSEDIELIKHCRKSLLFDPQGQARHRTDSLFDVTTGAPDGAEVCELVGVYLLSKIQSVSPASSFGLYLDDGLILVNNPNGPLLERIRKALVAIFQAEGLKITVSPPSDSVDYLDVTFRADGSFRPFRKAEKVTQCVNRQSNHPP